MNNADLSAEDHERIRRVRAHLDDVQTQRRISEARRAFAGSPFVARQASAVVDALGPAWHTFSDGVATWLRGIDLDRIRNVMATVGEALARLVPPNARELGVESWPEMQRLASQEQLCLSWVPGPALVRALIAEPDGGRREELLASSAREVLAACGEAVVEVRASLAEQGFGPDIRPRELDDVANIVVACVEAAQAGHYQAAQALATCATDTLLTQYVARAKAHTFVKNKLKLVDEKELAAVVLGPLLAAVDSCFRQPAAWTEEHLQTSFRPYGRNATIHAVSTDVFSEATMLKAVMIATSLLKACVNPLLFLLVDWLPAVDD